MKGLLFTYLLTYGGAVAALFNPFYGLLIYICFAVIKPESLWYWAVPEGNYSRIIAIAMLVGWAVNGFGRWDFGRGRPIVIALVGFLGWGALSAAFAPNAPMAWEWVEAMAKVVLPFVVGCTIIESTKQLRQVAWVLTLSQGYVAYELNMSYFGGFNRLTEAGFGGMDNNCVSIAMVAAAGVAFFLGLSERRLSLKLVAWACAALMAHTPMFGMSRGGMLGLIVSGIISFILIRKQTKYYPLFIVAVLIALRMAGPSVIERFSTTFADPEQRDASAQSRIMFWGYCQQFMADEPIFGVGPGHYPDAAQARFGHGGHAHSLWLQVGAEIGVPGLACLIAFYGLAIVRLWPLANAPADSPERDCARMVIAAIPAFAMSASFVSLHGLEFPYYVVLLGAALLKLTSRPQLADAEAAEAEWTDDPSPELALESSR